MLLKRHPIQNPALRIVTQVYGANPDWYRRFGLKGHNGIDFGIPTGTPIQAVDEGKVVEVYYDPEGFGHYVKLSHAWGDSLYAHLLQPGSGGPAVGQPVQAGTIIGHSDNTGFSTGPHLHFGIRVTPCSRDDGWMGYADPGPHLAELSDSLQRVREAAWGHLDVPFNPEAAIAEYARAKKLGFPVTPEFDAEGCRVQGFSGGIVYVVIGQWEQVSHLDW